MALTVSKLQTTVARRLGYNVKKWPVDLSIIDLANETGHFLCQQREWKWLERPETPLDVVANQEYVALPNDIAVVRSLETARVGGLGITAIPATMQVVVARRLAGAYGRCFWYSIATREESLSGPSPAPRLELGPVPPENISGAFNLVYRAGWKPVADAADHILVPAWLERGYVELAVAHARMSEKEHQGSLNEILAPAVAYMHSVAHNDQLMQADLGPWVGGAGYGAAVENVWPDYVERTVG